jgi:uncharacterized protein (TIGR03790 family)
MIAAPRAVLTRTTPSLARWVLTLALLPRPASGQSADNVLLVINSASPASVQIGEYYARRRDVKPDHIVRLSTSETDQIPRTEYEATIESPIGSWLSRHGLQDRVLYLVLTKGIPLRVAGTVGMSGTVASVDSELTVLYRKLVGLQPAVLGRIPNPYFLDQQDIQNAKPFSHADLDIYLVTRLDGYSVDDVMRLIDRGAAPSRDGKVVLDQRLSFSDVIADRWLEEAATRLRLLGYSDRVVLESTRALASSTEPALGYYSWGSNDRANRLRRFGIPFAAGAIAGMYVSTDGRTFSEPPGDWAPGGTTPTRYGTQSLAADLIRDGVTGVAGHVAEPYLNATIRPQILFPAYFSGFNLAESFYLAMPFLSWQTVVVGDPLCAPFTRRAPFSTELAPKIDSATRLPALFSGRRMAVVSRGGLNKEAVQLFLRAEVELGEAQAKEGEASLVRAVELEPRFDAANLRLADLYRERNDADRAIERYRRVLENDSRNLVALNNLAYALAVDKQSPKEALTFAERAYQLAPIPLVADTLGWVYYLLGDLKSALPYAERALLGASDTIDVLVHAAFIHEAAGDSTRAAKEVEAAEKLGLQLSQRPDVRALRDRLKPR